MALKSLLCTLFDDSVTFNFRSISPRFQQYLGRYFAVHLPSTLSLALARSVSAPPRVSDSGFVGKPILSSPVQWQLPRATPVTSSGPSIYPDQGQDEDQILAIGKESNYSWRARVVVEQNS